MANEQEDAKLEESDDIELEVEDGGEAEAEKPKKKFTDEEKLAHFEGNAARLRKKLGRETESQSKDKSEKKELSGELDSGQKALLVAYGIKGKDELELAKTWLKRTGDDIDTLVEDEVFQAKLDKLRKAKQADDATPKGTKRAKQVAGDNLAEAIAKYNETGELPQDRELREKVVESRLQREKSKGMFYN